MTTKKTELENKIETVEALLSYIQRTITVPKIRYNDFSQFHYRSCEDILEAIKKMLPEGAFLRLYDKPVLVGDRHYIEATVSLTFADESIAATAYAQESASKPKFDPAQLTGSASSYARKYALNGLFCIDDAQDPDMESGKDEKAKPEVKQNANEAKAKAWIADFTDQLMKCSTLEEVVDKINESADYRDRVAKGYPHLVAGMELAMSNAEERLK